VTLQLAFLNIAFMLYTCHIPPERSNARDTGAPQAVRTRRVTVDIRAVRRAARIYSTSRRLCRRVDAHLNYAANRKNGLHESQRGALHEYKRIQMLLLGNVVEKLNAGDSQRGRVAVGIHVHPWSNDATAYAPDDERASTGELIVTRNLKATELCVAVDMAANRVS
jgi:hypothetical protein